VLPAEIDRLPLERLVDHALPTPEQRVGERRRERPRGSDEGGVRPRGQRIAGVQRERRAVFLVQRGAAASPRRPVLDIVVHEERVVEQLERCRERKGGGVGPPKAAHAAVHSTGRRPFPDRCGYFRSRS
jgi:hypothetical protein